MTNSTAQHSTAQHSTAQHSTAQHSSRLHCILALFSSLIIFISFWLFSRFTVDDAFISWRYGKNLVDFGIWNYSPAIFDMTQAYTNPIFAVLSIIPNLFKIDVVLFFKINLALWYLAEQ
jgi:hypothetical protein